MFELAAVSVSSPSIALAFAAGFVSFVSPCVLPMVPGYLAAIAGGEPPATDRRVDPRLLARAGVFVGTFSLIFILLGLSATLVGRFLFDNQPTLQKVAGGVVIALGLFFIASTFVVRLNRDFHSSALLERAGRGGPVLAGAAFAIAWTPCVGPTLGAILGLASQSQSTGHGALLLSVYSLGLALPFMFSALAFNSAQRAFGFFKRHYVAVQIASGVALVALGVLMVTGEFTRLNNEATHALDGLHLNFLSGL